MDLETMELSRVCRTNFDQSILNSYYARKLCKFAAALCNSNVGHKKRSMNVSL
jgi:hypothetical protein